MKIKFTLILLNGKLYKEAIYKIGRIDDVTNYEVDE
jgi:hypothetical protein